jgi:L-serine dehydratase
MKNNPPSIFNDVIGPVMRGPSSSHTAASVRIGNMVRQILEDKPSNVHFLFDPKGALATTYETQGSAMGLAAGLLGWEITHPELANSLEIAKKEGIEIYFKIAPINEDHPSAYRIHAENLEGKKINLTAISVGGGMIEFTNIEDFKVSLKGDFYESLFLFQNEIQDFDALKNQIEKQFPNCLFFLSQHKNKCLLNSKSDKVYYEEIISFLENHFTIEWNTSIKPVLPIKSQQNYSLAFTSYHEMLEYAKNKSISLAELAMEYESARAGISKTEVFDRMKVLVEITRNSIQEGLKGTSYEDRILGQQSHLILEAEKKKKVLSSPVNSIIAYTSALMEMKSAMGIIIAAPTAGSCGVLGGAVFGATEEMEISPDDYTRAFLAAGLIGVFIAKDYTFSAEEGGCQVECGAASGMAAAALAELMNGSYMEAINAASMALQNLVGLICDPVANRVEVPCLGKNILGATNALTAANMSMAGFDKVIPLDEVIQTMKRVGDELPSTLCCTGLSGLSITQRSKEITWELFTKKKRKS